MTLTWPAKKHFMIVFCVNLSAGFKNVCWEMISVHTSAQNITYCKIALSIHLFIYNLQKLN